MEFRILGPLEVWESDRRLPLGGAKQRALLAILAIEANRVVPADRLIELLWGEEPPETAGNTLQVGISQIRKLLEPSHARGTSYQVLLREAPGYMLRIAPEQLDIHRFERLREQAREARLRGRPDSAASFLRDALGLWRGSPLTDLKAEPFAIAEATRLTELRMQALEERIDADLALGRHADLVGELEALVAESPLRERFQGQLMLALYRSGRQAEASDVFHKTRAALVDELGMEPGPDLQKLFTAILKQDPNLDLVAEAVTLYRPRTDNLPLQLTSFVGRILEKTEAKRLLSQSRLVTITGVGGVGKTRLAIEVAHELVPDVKDGVWLTELAPVADGSLVARMVASSLGLREQPERRIEDVMIAFLEGRYVLLLIDNCEHLVQAVAELVETLLRGCANVRVLATSREALRVEGETAWALPPLALPTPDAGAKPEVTAQSEAVRLFHERAASTSFVPSQENLPSVVEICRQLDGLPLGIELAAVTLRSLPVQQVAASLDDRFKTLAAGPRTALRRQQTLETSIGWSYDLLSEQERSLFRRLAVFSGGFGVEHIKAICSGPPVEFDDAFRLLSSLVTKSLVTFDSSRPEARYSLLETVHQYALERLVETEEEEPIRHRHLDWYVSIAERAAVAIHGQDQAKWFELLDDEYSNLRQALTWASKKDEEAMAKLARALTFFWMVRCYFAEGRNWLQLALDIPTNPLARARLLTCAGLLACMQSDSMVVRTSLHEACELLEERGDPATMGQAVMLLGWDHVSAGQTLDGLALMERGVAVAREAGPSWELATNLNNLGYLAHMYGDRSSRPRILIEEALGIARELGDAWVYGLTLDSLAQVAADNSDVETARTCWQECIAIAIHLKDRFGLPAYLEGFARLAAAQRQYERAMRLMGAAARMTSETGVILIQPEWEAHERRVQAIREELGGIQSDSAWRRGHSMTLQEAIEYAIGSPQPAAATASLAPIVS
jgi:predicted ATPase/DNA-binding SARP family transcriptional activator